MTGSGCASAAECPSGFCVDDDCCDTACDATCQACNVPGSEGTCTPIPAGQDPAGECGPNGACDGLGGRRSRNGAACAARSECLSAHCADAVCCDTACTGTCERCNLAGSVGVCSAVPAGADSQGDCPVDAATTCGRTGLCSGSRSCSLYASGTLCAAQSCASASTLNRIDRCDGAGACVDGGLQDCAPYACDSTANSCRSACANDSQCAPGFRCEVATGLCLSNYGQACTGNAGCFGHACCASVCRDLTSDPNNCGACGVVCTNPYGTTACAASACSPTCSFGWGSCDGNPNNGCELNHAVDFNTCATATEMGTYDGDTRCGLFCPVSSLVQFNSASGIGGAWFHARAREASDCSASIEHQVRLLVPAGAQLLP